MNILLPLLRLLLAAVLPAVAAAQVTSSVPTLPGVIVSAPTVANLSPAGTFAAPVTALRYEPRVDIQGRNLAEAQPPSVTARQSWAMAPAVALPTPSEASAPASTRGAPSIAGASGNSAR